MTVPTPTGPYEVIIVGAGPAGSATALFLLHHRPDLEGRILLLERRRFPREKFCAGALGARADRLLEEIGVRVDVPSVPIDGAVVDLPHGRIERSPGAIGRVIRRREFDHALARAARDRGAVVLEERGVTDFRVDRGGVRVEAGEASFRGRVLVGADGVGSTVRRKLGLPFGRLKASAVEVDTDPLPGDPSANLLHFDVTDRSLPGYAWTFPTPLDGKVMVCRGVYALSYEGGVAAPVTDLLARRLEDRGLRPEHLRVKRMAERGIELHRPYARPRVLLVGEAAGIDPITGEGIAPAIQYGSVAAEYLARKLRSGSLAFRDWRISLATSPVGADLALRRLAAHGWYRWGRPHLERLLREHPEAVDFLAAVFAGRVRPWRRWVARLLRP